MKAQEIIVVVLVGLLILEVGIAIGATLALSLN